jgi:hypothetical protein
VEQKFDNDSVDGPYGEGLFHFVDGADEEYEYSYDENGNMTKDLNRGIEEIRYNFLNLPSKITFTEKNAYIRNMYDANGHKFKMITYASMPLVIGRAAPATVSAMTAAYTMMFNDLAHKKRHRLFMRSNKYKSTHPQWRKEVRKQAFEYMLDYSNKTGNEIAAVVLENGNILVFDLEGGYSL